MFPDTQEPKGVAARRASSVAVECPYPAQIFDRSGKAHSAPNTVPPWCAALEDTPQGRTVCNRGCGFTLQPLPAPDAARRFLCPFRVPNVMIGLHDEGVLLGGRQFENYAQFSGFVEAARRAGAPEAALIACAPQVQFQALEAMEHALRQAAATVTPTPIEDTPEELLQHDEDEPMRPAPRPRPQQPARELWLQNLLEDLATESTLRQLSQTIVDAAARRSSARKISLFLLNARNRHLVLAASRGLPQSVTVGMRRPTDRGTLGHVFKSRERLIVQGVLENPKLYPSPFSHYDSDAFLCLPLSVGDRTLGVLNATDRHDHRPFAKHEVKSLVLIAQLGALALDRRTLSLRLRRALSRSLAQLTAHIETRSRFLEALDKECERSERTGQPLCLALLRPHVSNWLDQSAHPARLHRLLLEGVAHVVEPSLRRFDTVGRYDRDTFALLLTHIGRTPALKILGRIQDAVHERFLSLVPHQETEDTAIYLDIGLAEFPEDATSQAQLCHEAETSLKRGSAFESAEAQPAHTDLPEILSMNGNSAQESVS